MEKENTCKDKIFWIAVLAYFGFGIVYSYSIFKNIATDIYEGKLLNFLASIFERFL